LNTLLNSNKPLIKSLKISVLVRGEAEAKRLESELGVTPIFFKDFDDLEVLQKAASEHDGLISCSF
jgi:hypothetical protein